MARGIGKRDARLGEQLRAQCPGERITRAHGVDRLDLRGGDIGQLRVCDQRAGRAEGDDGGGKAGIDKRGGQGVWVIVVGRCSQLIQDEPGLVLVGDERVGAQEALAIHVHHRRQVDDDPSLSRSHRLPEPARGNLTLEQHDVRRGDALAVARGVLVIHARVRARHDDDGVFALFVDGDDR